MFTIIIPTHDRPQLLARTLESLVQQTFRDFTTIIVSDSSQYLPPYEHLKSLQGNYVYLLRNGKPGPAVSRNHAIRLVDTPYAIFLDDDDTFEPEHLASLADRIRKSPPSPREILYCDFCVLEEDRNDAPPRFLKKTPVSIPGVTRETIFVNNLIPNSSLIIPTPILQSAMFDPALILFEDWDYLLACLRSATLTHLPINSVNIHKSHVAGEQNLRRGNTNNDQLLTTTLDIYRRHPSPDKATQDRRRERFATLGIDLPAEYL